MRPFVLAPLLVSACATMKDDSSLDRLSKSLPPGWSMAVRGETLAIERREPVWVLGENRINAPMSRETDAQRSKRIREHGKQGPCRLVYRLEARWSAEKLSEARAANAEIDRQLAALGSKHDVARLRDASLSRKGGDFFKPQNADDEKRVQAFVRERDELRARRRTLPDLHSDRHSLFLATRDGGEDDMHIVDPPEAARELAEVERVARDALRSE